MTQQIQQLIKKFFRGECTPEEKQELLSWVAASGDDSELEKLLEDAWEEFEPSDKLNPERADAILNTILPGEQLVQPPPAPVRYLWMKKMAVASVIILLVGSWAYFQWTGKTRTDLASVSKHHPPSTNPVNNDAFPGRKQAILTLSDGSSVRLDTSTKGTISQQGNTTVTSRNGELFYSNTNYHTGAALYNTLNTHRGELFPLNLSDGSKVWLNSASSIRFPVAFNDAERVVDITGEAYFEVARDPAKPFKVKLNGMLIEVLGTHFNINGYMDESMVKTTLLEGSLRVSKGDARLLLTPGQQARLKVNGSIELVKEVNTEEAVSWKDGYFHFENASLETVMRQFSRWYDVDVEYENKHPVQTFGGDIEKNLNLSQALKILERSQVHCRIEGKKIMVL